MAGKTPEENQRRRDKGKQPVVLTQNPSLASRSASANRNARTSTDRTRSTEPQQQTTLYPTHARLYHEIEHTPTLTDRGRPLTRISSRDRETRPIMRNPFPAPSRGLRRYAFSHHRAQPTRGPDSRPTRALPLSYANLLRWFPVFDTETAERDSPAPSPETAVRATPWASVATTRLASTSTLQLPGERPLNVDSSSTLVPRESRCGYSRVDHPLVQVECIEAQIRQKRRRSGRSNNLVYLNTNDVLSESELPGDQRWWLCPRYKFRSPVPTDASERVRVLKDVITPAVQRCAPRARFANSKITACRSTEQYREWIAAPSHRGECSHPYADELRELTARPHLISALAEQLPTTKAEKFMWFRRSYKLKRYTPLNPTSGLPWSEASQVASTGSSVLKDSSSKGDPMASVQAPGAAPEPAPNDAAAQEPADIERQASGESDHSYSRPDPGHRPSLSQSNMNNQMPKPFSPSVAEDAIAPSFHPTNARHTLTPCHQKTAENVWVSPNSSQTLPSGCRYNRHPKYTHRMRSPNGGYHVSPAEGSRGHNRCSEPPESLYEDDLNTSAGPSRDKGKAPADPKLRANYYAREIAYQARLFFFEIRRVVEDVQTLSRPIHFEARQGGLDAWMRAGGTTHERYRTRIHDELESQTSDWGDALFSEEIQRFQEREHMRLSLLRMQTWRRETGLGVLCELFHDTAREVLGRAVYTWDDGSLHEEMPPANINRVTDSRATSTVSSHVAELPGSSVTERSRGTLSPYAAELPGSPVARSSRNRAGSSEQAKEGQPFVWRGLVPGSYPEESDAL